MRYAYPACFCTQNVYGGDGFGVMADDGDGCGVVTDGGDGCGVVIVLE